MGEEKFGPRRSRVSRKPWPECPDIVVYRCSHCGKLYQLLDYDVPAEDPVCCGAPMEWLQPLQLEAVSPEINVEYKIVGGFNQSAVQVSWETKQPEDKPQWVMLKTFTGSYIRYVTEKKRQPMVFPLADEDAYVYCDRSPCEKCVFRCKRGFIIYIYFPTKGLLEVPLDKISEYFNM